MRTVQNYLLRGIHYNAGKLQKTLQNYLVHNKGPVTDEGTMELLRSLMFNQMDTNIFLELLSKTFTEKQERALDGEHWEEYRSSRYDKALMRINECLANGKVVPTPKTDKKLLEELGYYD